MLEDDYRLIFSRSAADGKLRVAIKKTDRSAMKLAIDDTVSPHIEPNFIEDVMFSNNTKPALGDREPELLDAGNTGTYGHPVPTAVPPKASSVKCGRVLFMAFKPGVFRPPCAAWLPQGCCISF